MILSGPDYKARDEARAATRDIQAGDAADTRTAAELRAAIESAQEALREAKRNGWTHLFSSIVHNELPALRRRLAAATAREESHVD